MVLKFSDSCPKLALKCETNMVDAKWRIWEAKCFLLTQIQALEDGSLAKITYLEAESRGWPGLGREVKEICLDIVIPDLNILVSACRRRKILNMEKYNDTPSNLVVYFMLHSSLLEKRLLLEWRRGKRFSDFKYHKSFTYQ